MMVFSLHTLLLWSCWQLVVDIWGSITFLGRFICSFLCDSPVFILNLQVHLNLRSIFIERDPSLSCTPYNDWPFWQSTYEARIFPLLNILVVTPSLFSSVLNSRRLVSYTYPGGLQAVGPLGHDWLRIVVENSNGHKDVFPWLNTLVSSQTQLVSRTKILCHESYFEWHTCTQS